MSFCLKAFWLKFCVVIFCSTFCHPMQCRPAQTLHCPACNEDLGSKHWAKQQWKAKDVHANDWVWCCRSCRPEVSGRPPCLVDFTSWHLKMYLRYLDRAGQLGSHREAVRYCTDEHQKIYHQKQHRLSQLDIGHEVAGIFLVELVGKDFALLDTAYGAGTLFECFLGFLRQNGRTDLVAQLEASVWHMQLCLSHSNFSCCLFVLQYVTMQCRLTLSYCQIHHRHIHNLYHT